MASPEGFEPSRNGLEPFMLTLHYGDKWLLRRDLNSYAHKRARRSKRRMYINSITQQ